MSVPNRPAHRPPVPGETWREAEERRRLNRDEQAAWWRWCDERCVDCSHVRFHVTHEQDPEHSAEGPEYHTDIPHHAFVERMR
jgi:hypothetical protein